MGKSITEEFNPKPSCAGTGLLTLDIIFTHDTDEPPIMMTGGSCGNVMAIMAYLGWDSFPIARIGDDHASKIVRADLDKFSVHLDYAIIDTSVNTPIIVEKIMRQNSGKPSHRYYCTCPHCGQWLPNYRPITLNIVKKIKMDIEPVSAFYFDRVSPGAIELAQHMRLSGAMVIFEPASIKDERLFRKAVRLAHVVKYANDRIDSIDEFVGNTPLLIIETLGADGLKYKYLRENNQKVVWITLPAFEVEVFKDAAGSGDWCTAGLIHRLGQNGSTGLLNCSNDDIAVALQFGQALGALNCSFEGARGGMYALEREVLEDYVGSILEKHVSHKALLTSDADDIRNAIRAFCPSCGDGAMQRSSSSHSDREGMFVKVERL